MEKFCYYRGEANEEENLEEMARTANPEEISIDEDDEDEDEKVEGKIVTWSNHLP